MFWKHVLQSAALLYIGFVAHQLTVSWNAPKHQTETVAFFDQIEVMRITDAGIWLKDKDSIKLAADALAKMAVDRIIKTRLPECRLASFSFPPNGIVPNNFGGNANPPGANHRPTHLGI